MEDDLFDPSELSALVVDPNHYQRRISLDQLRGMGFRRAIGAGDSTEGWELLTKNKPDIVLVEWMDALNDGLDFIRRIRTNEESPNRAVAMFMLTSRGARADVETARRAGVDGYLRKPISAQALQQRVRRVVLNPQPFIETAAYVGPCRRRRVDPTYDGPMRRAHDAAAPVGDREDVDLKADLARAAVAALDACARDFRVGDAAAARRVFKASQELLNVAESIDDTMLVFGAKEIMRYLQALGSTDRLDPEVVRTHVAALHQLAHLPASLSDERDRVAKSLKRMVDKKLRQAAAA